MGHLWQSYLGRGKIFMHRQCSPMSNIGQGTLLDTCLWMGEGEMVRSPYRQLEAKKSAPPNYFTIDLTTLKFMGSYLQIFLRFNQKDEWRFIEFKIGPYAKSWTMIEHQRTALIKDRPRWIQKRWSYYVVSLWEIILYSFIKS